MIRFFSSGDPCDPKQNASEATQIQSDLELMSGHRDGGKEERFGRYLGIVGHNVTCKIWAPQFPPCISDV